MAARSPRRSFATPFVITLAAAPAACYVQSSTGPGPVSQPPPSSQPPTQSPTQPPPSTTPDTRPNPVVMNPPRPQPADSPNQTTPPPSTTPTQTTTSGDIRWTVMKFGNDCQAMVQADCPKGAMCNPPPPYKYACPDGVTSTQSLALVSHDNGATCTLEYPMPSCPPKASCNPPRPRPAACPKR